jgi:hypothetical protein
VILPAVLGVALAGLFFALCVLSSSGSAKQHERPRPTPELMAPSEARQPEPNENGRASYALIELPYVGRGW